MRFCNKEYDRVEEHGLYTEVTKLQGQEQALAILEKSNTTKSYFSEVPA